MWAGIAGAPVQGKDIFEVSISIHDSVYNTDFASFEIPYKKGSDDSTVEDEIIKKVKEFSEEHLCKFLGAGITLSLLKEVRRPGILPYSPLKLYVCLDAQSVHASLA